jgi:hypothetical protein
MATHSSHRALNLDIRRRFVPSRLQSLSLAQAFEQVLPPVRRPLSRISKYNIIVLTFDKYPDRSKISGGASL